MDKFLKVTRLIKRRTIANEVCDAEKVRVNGRPAKASYQVKAGDILELRFGTQILRAEVLLAEEPPRREPAPMYRELPDRVDAGE